MNPPPERPSPTAPAGDPRPAAEALLRSGGRFPLVGIVAHPGIRSLAIRLADRVDAPVRSLPGFEEDESGGLFLSGRLAGVGVVLLDPGPLEASHPFTAPRVVRLLSAAGVTIVLFVGPARSLGGGFAPGELLRIVEIEPSADPDGGGLLFDPALGVLLDAAAAEEGCSLAEAVVRSARPDEGEGVGADRPGAREITGSWFREGVRPLGADAVRMAALAIVASPTGEAEEGPVAEIVARFVDAVGRRPSLLIPVPAAPID